MGFTSLKGGTLDRKYVYFMKLDISKQKTRDSILNIGVNVSFEL